MQNNLNYPKEIYLLHNALSLGDSQIVRDYKELEFLQSNKHLPLRFATKLKEIIANKIIPKIEKSFPNHGIILNHNIIKHQNNDNYIVINLIEEEQNMIRALPFFTCNATICKITNIENDIHTTAAIVINPVLNLFFWANQSSNHAYEKNHRIKPSQTRELNKSYGIDFSNNNSINLNAITLELCYLASGKLDFIIKKFTNYTDIVAAIHIATISGIKFNIDFKNKIITATANDELLKKLPPPST